MPIIRLSRHHFVDYELGLGEAKMNSETTKEPLENRFGRLAFAYCKIATLSLLAGRFVLPVAAFLSASFFVISFVKGKKDTKCYLKYPLLAASFWVMVLLAWLAIHIRPTWFPPIVVNYFS